jgi:uncharacterized membrane protein
VCCARSVPASSGGARGGAPGSSAWLKAGAARVLECTGGVAALVACSFAVRLNRSEKEHPVARNVQTIAALEREALDERTHLDRLTHAVTRIAGSQAFILAHLVWFTSWIVVSSTRLSFDPYPFSLLNLVVALEAVFLTSIVLMTQNHMTRLADRRAHLGLQVNMLAEQELTAMLQMLTGLCTRLGVEVTLPDQHVEQLLTETDVRKIAVALEHGLVDA